MKIHNERNAGRKKLPYESVNRRVPVPLLGEFLEWRNAGIAKLLIELKKEVK